jgi:hypothetical protein
MHVVLHFYVRLFFTTSPDISGNNVTYGVDTASENNPQINNQVTLPELCIILLLHISKRLLSLVHNTRSTCCSGDGIYCPKGLNHVRFNVT